MRHRAKFRGDRSNRGRFQDGEHPAYLTSKSWKFQRPMSREGQYASSRQIWRRQVKLLPRYGCLSIIWRLSAILDLLCAFGKPTKTISRSLSLYKIWLEPMQKFFYNMQVFVRFCEFGLKMPIHDPFMYSDKNTSTYRRPLLVNVNFHSIA